MEHINSRLKTMGNRLLTIATITMVLFGLQLFGVDPEITSETISAPKTINLDQYQVLSDQYGTVREIRLGAEKILDVALLAYPRTGGRLRQGGMGAESHDLVVAPAILAKTDAGLVLEYRGRLGYDHQPDLLEYVYRSEFRQNGTINISCAIEFLAEMEWANYGPCLLFNIPIAACQGGWIAERSDGGVMAGLMADKRGFFPESTRLTIELKAGNLVFAADAGVQFRGGLSNNTFSFIAISLARDAPSTPGQKQNLGVTIYLPVKEGTP